MPSEAGRTQSVEAKIVTLNDVLVRLPWNFNTNNLEFQKANVPTKGIEAKEIFPPSLFAFYFVNVCLNLKVQMKFLHLSGSNQRRNTRCVRQA